jgi:hypothetical protein
MRSSLLVLAACCWCSPQTCFALGGSTCATAPLIYTVPYSDSGQLDSGLDPNCPGQPVNDLFYRSTRKWMGFTVSTCAVRTVAVFSK